MNSNYIEMPLYEVSFGRIEEYLIDLRLMIIAANKARAARSIWGPFVPRYVNPWAEAERIAKG